MVVQTILEIVEEAQVMKIDMIQTYSKRTEQISSRCR